MAMNTVIRRASRSILPRALREFQTPRIVHSSISAAVNGGRGSLVPGFSRASSLRFSTLDTRSEDEGLARVIDSEISCVKEPDTIATMPEGFPFKIQDLPGESTILMERVYRNEAIQVRVEMPTSTDDGDEESDIVESDEEDHLPVVIPLVVTVNKGSGFYLEIGATAFPGELLIESLSLKHPDAPEDRLLYEGPDYSELDDNLQKALLQYLEVRGINAEITNILCDYMIKKDNREYVTWLNNFKSFVLKSNH